MTKVAFVCVGNAGRSQMATAYAEAERAQRNLNEEIEIITGGLIPQTAFTRR
jgi:protein-tyrosine-phosphatase